MKESARCSLARVWRKCDAIVLQDKPDHQAPGAACSGVSSSDSSDHDTDSLSLAGSPDEKACCTACC